MGPIVAALSSRAYRRGPIVVGHLSRGPPERPGRRDRGALSARSYGVSRTLAAPRSPRGRRGRLTSLLTCAIEAGLAAFERCDNATATVLSTGGSSPDPAHPTPPAGSPALRAALDTGRQPAAPRHREGGAGAREDFLAPLDEPDRAALAHLLGRLATHHGLAPGVHPGYRTLGRGEGSDPASRGVHPETG
jgi:hypothetical protein